MEVQFKRTPVSPVSKLDPQTQKKSNFDILPIKRKKEGEGGFKNWILTPFPVKGSWERVGWTKGGECVGIKKWQLGCRPFPRAPPLQEGPSADEQGVQCSTLVQGWLLRPGVGGGGLVRVQSHRRSSDGAFPVVRLSPQHFPPPHSISLDPHLNTRHFSNLGFCYFDQLVLNCPRFWILQLMILSSIVIFKI